MKAIQSMNFGCYPGYCLLSYNFHYKEMVKELNKVKNNDWAKAIANDKELIDGGTFFALKRKYKGKNYFYIILTNEFKFSDYEMCKLAHEVLHVCQFYLPDILDRNHEWEAEAYLHTHLMQQCLKILRWKKSKK